MKNIILLFCLLSVSALPSCYSTKSSTASPNDFERGNDIENPEQSISLVDHLRRVAGVQVDGNGSNANIRIRGISSLNSSNEPLFVVNGQQVSGGLSDVMELVPVQQIKSIKVLKNVEETAFYGVRGANGVIEITLK